VIDLSSKDLRDRLREQVYAATNGRGADIILDPLGGAVFSAALRALAWFGRLVCRKSASPEIPTFNKITGSVVAAVEGQEIVAQGQSREPLSQRRIFPSLDP
jgi:NADPH:quinone reductase-like Zn-dependent oxidoreductase